jgi:hypothetical protein
MPPTQEMIEKAADCLGETQLVRFAADRTSVRAGQPVTVSWEVAIPAGCNLSVRLNHSQVSKQGSRTLRPVRAVAFRLDCGGAGLSKFLGQVNIEVDTTGCAQRELPEAAIVPGVLAGIDENIAEYNAQNEDRQITKRRETVIEFEPDGILVRLRLKLQINNWFDPDVDIDAKIDVGLSSEGEVIAFYRSFAVDVDWPWWVTGMTLGIAKLVEEFIDVAVENNMKSRILNDLRRQMRNLLDSVPGTVADVAVAQDVILAIVCQGGVNPSRGVLHPIGHGLILTHHQQRQAPRPAEGSYR